MAKKSKKDAVESVLETLIAYRNAAEVANGNAQEMIRSWREKPRYTISTNFEHIAKAQKRQQALISLQYDAPHIKHIRKACEFGEEALDEQYLVETGAFNHREVHVGDYSYPTAHEAAFALGKFIIEMWDSVGGDHELSLAPDRLEAESDGRHADAALKMRVRLWRQITEAKTGLPRDLWGRIQNEFNAAVERHCPLDDDESYLEDKQVELAEADQQTPKRSGKANQTQTASKTPERTKAKPLNETAESILKAMLQLGATEKGTRFKAEVIASKCRPIIEAGTVRSHMSKTLIPKFVTSHRAAGESGYWLTPAGKKKAEQLR